MFRHVDQEKNDDQCEKIDDNIDDNDIIETIEIAIIHNVADKNEIEKDIHVDVP